MTAARYARRVPFRTREEVGVFVGYFVPGTTTDRRRVFVTDAFCRRAVVHRAKTNLSTLDSNYSRFAGSISQISSEM
jgi:hypothetical protein